MTVESQLEPIVAFFGVLVLVYLIALFRLLYKLKRSHPDFWAHIGSPSMFGLVDQIPFFKIVIFGRGLPPDLNSHYRINLLIVRGILGFHVVVFFIYVVAVAVVGL